MKKIIKQYVDETLANAFVVSFFISLSQFIGSKYGFLIQLTLFLINFICVLGLNFLIIYNKNIFKIFMKNKFYKLTDEGLIYNCYWYRVQASKKYAKYLEQNKDWDVMPDNKKIELFLFAENGIISPEQIIKSFKNYFNMASEEAINKYYSISRLNDIKLRIEIQKRYINSISIVEKAKLLKEIERIVIEVENLKDENFKNNLVDKYGVAFLTKCTQKTKNFLAIRKATHNGFTSDMEVIFGDRL